MDNERFARSLWAMDEQLRDMIAAADAHEDFLLGALLCEAHACVLRRVAELPPG